MVSFLMSINFASAASTAQILVIGGGAGGYGSDTTSISGGGGAGGYQYNSAFPLTVRTYTVTIGAGGASSNNGNNSIFDTLTATGGGTGGHTGSLNGANGGSGGGGGSNTGTGGTGSQGNNGGNANTASGGGGGGSSAVGANSTAYYGGNGGNGTQNNIDGLNNYYGGGGGGAGYISGPGGPGTGGTGGGGAGASTDGGTGVAGTANTGGGGGAGGYNGGIGGAGGAGIVIVAYPTGSITATGGTITTSGGNTIHTFTISGTFTVSELIPTIIGSGTVNRIAKFTATSTIGDSMLSDDGSNTTLTSGNFFMQIGSLIDSVTSGALNFGTTNATTMTFGRSGQNMIINSKVGIGTSTPTSTLHIIGDLFANFINVAPNGLGLDTSTTGVLSVGSTTASSIKFGNASTTTSIPGIVSFKKASTESNCNSTAAPSTCGSASAGSIALPIGISTLVVNTTAVTVNSQILITEDSSLGSRLGITCNTTTGRVYSVNARTASTSFTVKSSANPATNKACLSYWIIN